MRKLSLIVVLSLVALIATTGLAFANHTSGADTLTMSDSSHNGAAIYQQGDALTKRTYENQAASGGCQACHGWDNVTLNTRAATRVAGPHGFYTATSGKCITCHVIHTNSYGNGQRVATNSKLLPGNTVTAVCNYCHDLTGSVDAPYSTRYLGQFDVKSGHYVEGATAAAGINAIITGKWNSLTVDDVYKSLNMPGKEAGPLGDLGNVIPGGNASTGGTVPIVSGLFEQGDFATEFGGTKLFTCDSCHTPHGMSAKMVAGYLGETERTVTPTSRLLKKDLLGGQAIASYGSAWCAGCHQGRNTMAGSNYNHPVNVSGLGYLTSEIAADAGAAANVVGGESYDATVAYDVNIPRDAGKTNAWYAMASDDAISGTARNLANGSDGYIDISYFKVGTGVGGPSCQQCHASARDVEEGFDSEGLKATLNSAVYTGNPFTTFPHVSRNRSLLVENGDDLCTNCHGVANLP